MNTGPSSCLVELTTCVGSREAAVHFHGLWYTHVHSHGPGLLVVHITVLGTTSRDPLSAVPRWPAWSARAADLRAPKSCAGFKATFQTVER